MTTALWVFLTAAVMLFGRSSSTKVVAGVFFVIGIAFALDGPWNGISDMWSAR